MGIENKTVGKVRYWNYYLIFQDGEEWSKSVAFVHELQFELKNTTFGKDPGLARDILIKGECSWKDHNGGRHLVKVSDTPCEDRWGIKLPNRHSRRRAAKLKLV